MLLIFKKKIGMCDNHLCRHDKLLKNLLSLETYILKYIHKLNIITYNKQYYQLKKKDYFYFKARYLVLLHNLWIKYQQKNELKLYYITSIIWNFIICNEPNIAHDLQYNSQDHLIEITKKYIQETITNQLIPWCICFKHNGYNPKVIKDYILPNLEISKQMTFNICYYGVKDYKTPPSMLDVIKCMKKINETSRKDVKFNVIYIYLRQIMKKNGKKRTELHCNYLLYYRKKNMWIRLEPEGINRTNTIIHLDRALHRIFKDKYKADYEICNLFGPQLVYPGRLCTLYGLMLVELCIQYPDYSINKILCKSINPLTIQNYIEKYLDILKNVQ